MRIPLTVLLTLFFGLIYCQSESEFELTKIDITKINDINSNDISVFGIKLGMTKDEVENRLSQVPNLYIKLDTMHTTKDYRLYIYDKEHTEYHNGCILYLIWENSRKDLNKIVFYKGFNFYLKGLTKDLLTLNSVDSESDIYKRFLVKPDTSKITLEIPCLKYRHVTYYYKEKGIEITHQIDLNYDTEKVVFAIVK